jgi:hypothetical protein
MTDDPTAGVALETARRLRNNRIRPSDGALMKIN